MISYDERRQNMKWRTLQLSLAIAFVMFLYVFSVQAEELSPEFGNPLGIGYFEVGSFIVWACIFVFFVRQSIRAGTLSFGLLLLFSVTTMFWQETYADWGAYLLYNPKFALMPWGTTLWTSPNKPWMLIPAYGWYHIAVYLAMLWMITKLRTYLPKLGHTAAVLIVAVPIFYAWDLFVEGCGASLFGWWTYVNCWGPAIVSSKGNYPLLYPVLVYTLCGVVTVWVLSFRGPDGHVRFESWFRVERIHNSFYRELARIGVWILVMNVLFFILTIPLISIRVFFGVPSTLVS